MSLSSSAALRFPAFCCLCKASLEKAEMAAHVLDVHIGASARILWRCGECAFDGLELLHVAAHCFSAGHDVGRMCQSQPREAIQTLRRVQAESESAAAASPPSELADFAAPRSRHNDSPAFTAEVRRGAAFSLDELRSGPSGLGEGLAQPPSLKRGPPSLCGEPFEDPFDFKAPRMAAPMPAEEQSSFLSPASELTAVMEERALGKSGNAPDERTMKAYAWLLTREIFPEPLLAGFDCIPLSLRFGKYGMSRSSSETMERQPAEVQWILQSAMRRFGLDGLPDEQQQARLRLILEHLKTNRYNIRRKLACPCGQCKKPVDSSFL